MYTGRKADDIYNSVDGVEGAREVLYIADDDCLSPPKKGTRASNTTTTDI